MILALLGTFMSWAANDTDKTHKNLLKFQFTLYPAQCTFFPPIWEGYIWHLFEN